MVQIIPVVIPSDRTLWGGGLDLGERHLCVTRDDGTVTLCTYNLVVPFKQRSNKFHFARLTLSMFGGRQSIAQKGVRAIAHLEMAQMLQKAVFALPGCREMSVNTLLCDTLGLADSYPPDTQGLALSQPCARPILARASQRLISSNLPIGHF